MKKNKVTICQRCGAKIEGVVDVCPYCGAKIEKTPFYKKKWFLVIAAILIIGMVGSVFRSCGSGQNDTPEAANSSVWPDTELGQMLPDTDAKIASISADDEWINAELEMTIDEYKAYVEKCKEAGFTEEPSLSEDTEYCMYDAKNSSGYELSLSWDSEDGHCSLYLNPPEEEEVEEKETEPEKEESEEEPKEEKKKSSEKKESKASSDGVTPEFKEAMDEYEEFFDEYVEVMKNYSKDPTGYLTEYAEFMKQYSETMKKLDEIDEDSLSAADSAYYLEVMARINKKLAEVSQ